MVEKWKFSSSFWLRDFFVISHEHKCRNLWIECFEQVFSKMHIICKQSLSKTLIFLILSIQSSRPLNFMALSKHAFQNTFRTNIGALIVNCTTSTSSLYNINSGHSKGAFKNHVDQVLPNFDHLTPSSGQLWTFYIPFVHVTKLGLFTDHLPTSFCLRDYWMPPKTTCTRRCTHNRSIATPKCTGSVGDPRD